MIHPASFPGPVGYEEGVPCNRNGCKGLIDIHPSDNCSCHINPPCSSCTSPRGFCPVCGWEEAGEERLNGFVGRVDAVTQIWKTCQPRQLDSTKIDYHVIPHTHFSQICEGVFPEGTTRDDVLARVKGTFGGRFDHFGNGKFKYVAYTD